MVTCSTVNNQPLTQTNGEKVTDAKTVLTSECPVLDRG